MALSLSLSGGTGNYGKFLLLREDSTHTARPVACSGAASPALPGFCKQSACCLRERERERERERSEREREGEREKRRERERGGEKERQERGRRERERERQAEGETERDRERNRERVKERKKEIKIDRVEREGKIRRIWKKENREDAENSNLKLGKASHKLANII